MGKETLEEASSKVAHMLGTKDSFEYVKMSFELGAKWQQKRSYSEEEVMDMFHNFSMHLPLHYEFLVKEQFKKK